MRKPSEWEIKAKELEAQFLTLEGPLDSPERTALWPELASAYSGARKQAEAAVCWLDALWDACEEGDGQACDDLYFQSPFDSEYEEFGKTCGGRLEGVEAETLYCADAI